jgi:hypothetical protein
LLTGAVVGEAVMEGEAAATDLVVAVAADSAVVTHSTAMALVRDSAGRGDFLLVDFPIAEITTALVTVVSVDATATFAIIDFAILMGTFSISAPSALDIQIITPITTHTRITTTMGI